MTEPTASRRRAGRAAVAVAVAAAVAVAVVVAIVTRSGSAWVFEPGVRTTSLVSDGERVCGAAGEVLHCLDADTGGRRLSRRLGGPVLALALVGRTLVVGVGAEDGAARQLRAYTLDGRRLWTVALREGTVVTSPLPVARDRVVAVIEGPLREPIGIDVATGEELWRIAAPPRKPYEQRAVAGLWVFGGHDRFYLTRIADVGCHIAAVDTASGTELWRSTRLADSSLSRGGVSVGCPNVLAAVALERERAIAFAVYGLDDQRLLALDAENGSPRWDAPLPVEGLTRSRHLAYVGGVLVAVSGRRLTAFGGDGEQLWTRSVGEDASLGYLLDHTLVVDEGVLYHADGGLSRVDPRTGEGEVMVEERTDDGEFRALADVEVVGDRTIVAGRAVEGLP